MKVFISWSGPTSNTLAEELRNWLPNVIQAVKPYYSPADIDKGTRWSTEIASVLEESRFGLICVTRENLEAPWIMFEAGALSKNLGKAKVAPLLFGVEPADLTGPLVQFQAAKFEKSEIRKVLRSVNKELTENPLESTVLDSVFEMWWPKLEEKVAAVMETHASLPDTARRPDRDILEEILMLTRSQGRRSRTHIIHPGAVADLTEGLTELIENMPSVNPGVIGALERMHRATDHVQSRSLGTPITKSAGKWEEMEALVAKAGSRIDDLKITLEDEDDALSF